MPLSEYALLGDGRTAALVARDGSIDWLCLGRFDGPAVFCRLLDKERGGYFRVSPDVEFQSSRRYLGQSNVLVTDFECANGTLRITDCMPMGFEGGSAILRKVEVLSGEIPIRVEFVPTFDFARSRGQLEFVPGGCTAVSGAEKLSLSCPATMSREGEGATVSFSLGSGQTRWIVLSAATRRLSDDEAARALEQTVQEWDRWSAQGRYPLAYRDILRRSALVLKALIYAPTGAILAAPTTSLPEAVGGSRNWDYRFTWLRDASWVVSALMGLGYHEESMAFIGWLESLDLGPERPSVFYDLEGHLSDREEVVQNLSGYRDSRPVRIGNAAAGQEQHDVFGEVAAAIHLCSERMSSMRPVRPELWKLLTMLADRAANDWERPDHGMWEVRDNKRHFVSSKVLCWTAIDRTLKIAARDDLTGPILRWRTTREQIRRSILDEGYCSTVGFRREFGAAEPDAAGLLLSRYGFLPIDDPRIRRTIEVVQQRLSVGGGLLRRYLAPDGNAETEGAFTACSFWLVDCLACQGRLDQAQRLFEEVLSYTNDVGLLSEQIDPASGGLLGNFPQAFSHLALIRAAMSIAEGEGGCAL